jgi:hypothetical protein
LSTRLSTLSRPTTWFRAEIPTTVKHPVTRTLLTFQLSCVSKPLSWDCRLMPKRWTFLWVTPGGRFQIMAPFELLFDQMGSLVLLEDGGILAGGSAVQNDDVGGAVSAKLVVAGTDGHFQA